MVGRRHVLQTSELLLLDEPSAPPGEFTGVYSLDAIENLELIDETTHPTQFLDPDLRTPRGTTSRPLPSAVPRAQPIGRQNQSLAWGSGTDGWPRHNSRLVRLFLCSPNRLVDGCAGRRWGALDLTPTAVADNDAEASLSVGGFLQMPYPSSPLEVELRAQPFDRRFTRVDLVLRSRHRWPRRYFDVASRSLTTMQVLERSVS